MVINDLSPAARSAAMRGGTEQWGSHGSSIDHVRYMEALPAKFRKRCACGCKSRATYRGMANGVCLVVGCELRTRRWVRDAR